MEDSQIVETTEKKLNKAGDTRGGQNRIPDHVLEQFLKRVSNGETATSACAQLGIHFDTITKLKARDADFASRYASAREAQLDAWVDQMIDIADDATSDTKTLTKGGKEVEVVNWENVRRAELRVQVRQWHLEKRRRKEFGVQDPELEKKSIAADLLEIIKLVHSLGSSAQDVMKIQVAEEPIQIEDRK